MCTQVGGPGLHPFVARSALSNLDLGPIVILIVDRTACRQAYLEAMVNMFGRCTRETEAKLLRAIDGKASDPGPPLAVAHVLAPKNRWMDGRLSGRTAKRWGGRQGSAN